MNSTTKIQNSAEADRMMRARIRLLIDHPWFGQLSLNLKMSETTKCPAMATDGTHLFYNPFWTATQTDDVLTGTVAHESSHCGLRHMYRCNGREMKEWNQATDYAINQLLDASNLQLPEGVLRDAAYSGLAAETIYAKLIHEREEKKRQEEQENAQNGEEQDDRESDPSEDSDEQDQSNDEQEDEPADAKSDEPGEGEGEGQPNFDDGDLLPAPKAGDGKDDAAGDEADAPLTEMDWEIIADQATMVASKRGLMPAFVERAFRETLEPKVNWREVLRRFVDQTMPSDYNWNQPNRRYISQGLYLPAVIKENAPRLLVALDTSGSIDQNVLDSFAAELTAIMMEVRPVAIDVVCCDARIQSVQTFTPDDGEIRVDVRGGGGTAFQPVFDWVEEQDEQPAAIIYLTDLDGDEPREPSMPVLWITPEYVTRAGLFGETIRVPAGVR